MTELLNMIKPEWVSAIASSIGVIAILLLWIQLRADHERSRREKSIELILNWAQNLNENASSARKLVEELDEKQSRCLYKQENFSIDEKYEELLRSCYKGTKEILHAEKNNKNLILNESDVSHVRWLIVTYLNSIEAMLSAWRHNVADKDIIEEELRFLISPEKGHYLLKDFRVAAGGVKSYPSIEEFVKHIEKDINGNSKGKKKIA